ncbi:unnamed protein product (macronuclear) [Paramecium tetraurelia]|uniref:Tubby C-terminal domain-containing protein n=1 Tax=Paramecium tetraurelia TaxID=5888 RepID=A0EG93_PARTE|nr:uncharacterized protein GSPATT00026658001 [Paramecium tetraurelia]CAK94334.1 unnamed protein product [Paramecium tetraurelia]|eukprot:XP_001461707.1 hypothetical protein (macronuclear) [Paramecium tetraurelia strain d4-2]
MSRNNSEEENIIQFDDDDNQQEKNHKISDQQQMKIRKDFQDEEIIHEPGMQQINQQEQDLNNLRLNRPKTSAQQMKIQESQLQQQEQQNQFQQIQYKNSNNFQHQSEESSNNSEQDQHNQSLVNFQSEMGEQVEQEDINQQVQPNPLQLQRIEDNDQQSQFHESQQSQSNIQPPLSSSNQSQVQVNPFPPKLDYQYVREQMESQDKGKAFLTSPLIQDKTLQCSIKRDKSGLARLYPVYHVYTSEGDVYLFSAKKVVMNTTSNYVISMDKREFSTRKSCFLGKVRSNFLGTEFILWDEGKNLKKCKDTSLFRTQLGIVYYESHIMQNKGPRKMKVLIPRVGDRNIPKVFQPLHNNEGIQYDYQNNKREFIEEFINKPPRWDAKMKAHVLNFFGRVDKPSVKNFQLVKPNNHQFIHLQFGRVDDLLFNLDFCYPLSPLQAFQICVTSFDFKFACE